jgi:hypothetical protein
MYMYLLFQEHVIVDLKDTEVTFVREKNVQGMVSRVQVMVLVIHLQEFVPASLAGQEQVAILPNVRKIAVLMVYVCHSTSLFVIVPAGISVQGASIIATKEMSLHLTQMI